MHFLFLFHFDLNGIVGSNFKNVCYHELNGLQFVKFFTLKLLLLLFCMSFLIWIYERPLEMKHICWFVWLLIIANYNSSHVSMLMCYCIVATCWQWHCYNYMFVHFLLHEVVTTMVFLLQGTLQWYSVNATRNTRSVVTMMHETKFCNQLLQMLWVVGGKVVGGGCKLPLIYRAILFSST